MIKQKKIIFEIVNSECELVKLHNIVSCFFYCSKNSKVKILCVTDIKCISLIYILFYILSFVRVLHFAALALSVCLAGSADMCNCV